MAIVNSPCLAILGIGNMPMNQPISGLLPHFLSVFRYVSIVEPEESQRLWKTVPPHVPIARAVPRGCCSAAPDVSTPQAKRSATTLALPCKASLDT